MKPLPQAPAAFRAFQDKFPVVARAWELLSDAGRHGPLDEPTQRLVKLGIAIGSLREGAVHSAVRKALAAGVPREAIEQVIALSPTTIGLPASVAAFSWIQEQIVANTN